jgi:hypothetical protein
MELVIRRRSKGLSVLLSFLEAVVTSVQTEDGHRTRQPVVVGLSLYLIQTSGNFSFNAEKSIHFSQAFAFANLSRGPPELVKKRFVKNLME